MPNNRYKCQHNVKDHGRVMKHSCPAIIAPSLLSCDLARLADDAQNVLSLGGDWLVRIQERIPKSRSRRIVPLLVLTSTMSLSLTLFS
jgi:hypothetical protein